MSNISKLMRWSGLASMLGGVLFSISIILHPLRHGEAVNNSPYSAIHVLIAIALTLVLFGLVGLFLRQSEEMTGLGLAGFILAFIGNIWVYGLIITEGFVWPTVGFYNPDAVHNFDPNLPGPEGGELFVIFFLGMAVFAVGYTMFGIATMRAGVLPRFAGLLIAIGAIVYIIGGFTIVVFGPESFAVSLIEIIGAVPFGLGITWLGYTLWSGTGEIAEQSRPKHD